MRRGLVPTLLATLGAAAACAVDEPTAPEPHAPRPAADVAVVISLATLLGRTTVDAEGLAGPYSSLASSADGTQHIAYWDGTKQILKYAVCASNCTVAANWQRGVVDQSADVGRFASLRVQSGVRHVVYFDGTNRNLKYAKCSADCLMPGSWSKGVIASVGDVGWDASLAISPQSGRLHVSYVDATTFPVKFKYATCLLGCTSVANWQRATIDGAGSNVAGFGTSIALGADGRRHVSYQAGKQLRYATCSVSCGYSWAWKAVTADPAPYVGAYSSLAVDANGVRHVSYYDHINLDLKYARCASNCTSPAGWSRLAVDKGAGALGTDVGQNTSLAVGDGRVHVSYYDWTGGRLKYASCAGGCLQAASWSPQFVDGGCLIVGGCTNVGSHSSLKLGGGKVHVSYHASTNGNLKYAELAP
jgi:hypothetical protein